MSVLLNNGGGTFAAKVDYTVGYRPQARRDRPTSTATASPTSSSHNAGDGTVSVLLNNGGGTFAPQQVYGTGIPAIAPSYTSSSITLADLGGDSGRHRLLIQHLDQHGSRRDRDRPAERRRRHVQHDLLRRSESAPPRWRWPT